MGDIASAAVVASGKAWRSFQAATRDTEDWPAKDASATGVVSLQSMLVQWARPNQGIA
jgi:hypothetical protein